METPDINDQGPFDVAAVRAVVEEHFPNLWPDIEAGLAACATLLLADNANPPPGDPQAVCDPCISGLDGRLLVIPLLDFLVCLFRNTGLDDLLPPVVDDELLPVLTE